MSVQASVVHGISPLWRYRSPRFASLFLSVSASHFTVTFVLKHAFVSSLVGLQFSADPASTCFCFLQLSSVHCARSTSLRKFLDPEWNSAATPVFFPKRCGWKRSLSGRHGSTKLSWSPATSHSSVLQDLPQYRTASRPPDFLQV